MISEKERNKIAKVAQKHAKKGKLQEAIAEYQKLLTENSVDLSVRSTLGDLYVRSNQKEKAIEEFQKIASHYEERGLYSQSMAVYKKINRLNPSDIKIGMKLADLFHNQGFLSEAKREYQRIAGNLKENNRVKAAIRLYEKLLKLDERDVQSRLTLAQLYKEEKLFDQAVEEFNKVAEFKMQSNALKEAEEILNLAKDLKKDHSRTTANIIDLLKRENKNKEALGLINQILEKDKENVEALNLLGHHYFEEKDFKKAEDVYSKIVSLQPKDVEARIKLGRIYIQQERLDEALDIYAPLVDSLIKKQKEEKAIGLLGLILKSKKVHLPTLEKLASVFKSVDQKKNLEVVYRVVLEEYKKNDMKKEALAVLSELVGLCPEDEEIKDEYTLLREELGPPEEEPVEEEEKEEVVEIEEEKEEPIEVEEVREEPIEAEELVKEKEEKPIEEEKREEHAKVREEVEEGLEANLTQADLYVEQGLVKSAKRILENLRLEHPEEPRIEEKLAALEGVASQVKEEEIHRRLEKVSEKETEILGKKARKKTPRIPEKKEEEKITSAEVFAETDITPVVSKEEREKDYYDLVEKIDGELDVIKTVSNRQIEGETTVFEKELADIVAEFTKALEEEVDQEDYESHFNLGIAFLEQELIEEAIQELKLASQDEKRAVECYSVLSHCYRQKKDFQEAVKWVEKALKLSDKDSSQSFDLKYEIASLYEELRETKKALNIYNEINKWNAEYRDKAKRIENLKKS